MARLRPEGDVLPLERGVGGIGDTIASRVAISDAGTGEGKLPSVVAGSGPNFNKYSSCVGIRPEVDVRQNSPYVGIRDEGGVLPFEGGVVFAFAIVSSADIGEKRCDSVVILAQHEK